MRQQDGNEDISDGLTIKFIRHEDHMPLSGKNAGRFHQPRTSIATSTVEESHSVAVQTCCAAGLTDLEVGHHSSGTLGACEVVIVAKLA